ncbi:hypothetical protein [Chryseobacterium sp. G0201]|uniref:hypothetical protein n=1 Tax=Chryseobacterium sp. G0201 TaxID=2487065 RepID=UPI000F50F523|nr:hypothetical protein [Chryseobacterium sp. G0201]AZA51548.1 hypothetical protein EG348_00280 [Chryseobacterium sp. G0201]
MRKIIALLSVITGIIIPTGLQAQHEDINFGDLPRPVPSVSSLASYTDAPVSLATGVPDIQFPLLRLTSYDKNIAANLSLGYHPLNTNEAEAGSEVGIGWSMFAGGVISREVVDELDERYDDANWAYHKKNKFNDIYYYNLPGISGKFKIERNIDANTFQVVNLTPNNIKIEYTRTSNTATLIVNSFTITDDNGYKYIFNDYSQAKNYSHPSASGALYKSAFYLTQIKNANNVELLNFIYQKENKNKPGTSELLYQSCKLKTMVSPGIGSIDINYHYDAALEGTMNDPYSITNVSLKNTHSEIISQYGLIYSDGLNQGYIRKLIKINKINLSNPTGNPLETTKLVYNTFYFNSGDGADRACTAIPPETDTGISSLHRVILPTGGMVEYNFEANQYYINKSTPNYVTPESFSDPEVQFIQSFAAVDFDVPNGTTKTYTFQVTGEPNKDKPIYIDFDATKYYPYYGPADPQSFVDYVIDNDPALTSSACYAFNDEALEGRSWSFRILSLKPGSHTIKITGTGGHGIVGFSDIGLKPLPYKNAVSNNKKLGIRIRDIKYYNSELDYVAKKTVAYDYNMFNDPNSVSGYQFYPEMESTSTEYSPIVLYKNVKVTNNEDNGYVKYYFKNPNDYPKTPYTYNGNSTQFWPYYNMTKTGVMDKKEVFDNQNKLVSSVNYDFTFETLNQMPEVPVDGGVTKKAFMKSTKVTTKDYTGANRFVESKTETEFNPVNFKVASVKETSSDGNITERTVTYAAGLADYQNLQNAYMNGIPVKTEIKSNGKLVSNSQVKYENAGNLYPSSVISINPNDNSTKAVIKYDQYDSKGNIRQFTSHYDQTIGSGISTVMIWGYNQSLPIAKIEGATVFDIGNLADDIILKSNADLDASTETALINALDIFRTNSALKNTVITTYTYDPLIGATTVTPPNGMREIYKYDKNGKLTSTVDVNGNVIKDYKYNTKPQL